MTVFRKSPSSWRRAAWLTAFVAVFATTWVATDRAQTQEDDSSPEASLPAATAPYSLFQYSTLTGSGNTITAVEIPVVTSSGVIYEDVTLTLQFAVSESNKVTVTAVNPTLVPSPRPLTSSFEPGNYEGPSTLFEGQAPALITVTGPGVANAGATEWSLYASTGADRCTYPASGMWYVGSSASNPYAERIAAAKIPAATVAAYSGWGVGGTTSDCFPGNSWYPKSLLAFSQTDQSLSIVSFTTSGIDYPQIQDQITYTLLKQQ